jgi:hypothetical protein
VADGPAQVEVQDAGFDPGDPVDGIDVEDAVQVCRHDDDRSFERRGAACEARATSARHERTLVTCRDPHRRRDVGTRRREAHDPRLAAFDARVASVEEQLQRLGACPVGAERGLEIGEERAVVVDVRSLPTRSRYARS